MTTLRLMSSAGPLRTCKHEFEVKEDPSSNSILHYQGEYYVYHDAGDDWEEWVPAEIIELNVTLHSELTGVKE